MGKMGQKCREGKRREAGSVESSARVETLSYAVRRTVPLLFGW